jgi:uncharacterized DUF497 family protein
MAAPRFEWDPRKDAENQRKHRISFEEAKGVFADEHAVLLDDPDHSATEERFVLMGLSAAFRVLVVVHTYVEMRIQSASSPHGGQPSTSVSSTTRGGINEARIRLFERPAKSLR